MKQYETYKNSGVEWLGNVPDYWESWKISHAFKKIGSGTTPQSGNPIYYENGTINWLNTGDLNDGVLYSCAKKVTPKAIEDNSSLKLFPKGSLVIAMYGATIGKTALLQFETTTNQACCVFNESDIIDIEYLQYWFKGNKEHIINLAIGGGQPNISQDILKGIRLYCPIKEEQTQIANYLNHKTKQLDTLIAKKEQLISLLQEERTAMINQAVTKGLDPNVPMKDVKEDGLDKIPNHWRLLKFKWLAPILTCGVASTPEYVDESIGVPFLSAQNVKNNKMRLDKYKYIPVELHEKLTKLRKPLNGDLLVTRVGAGIGDACIVDCDFDFSVYVSLTHIRVDESIVNNKFIMYFFSTDYCKFLNNYGTVTGGGVGNLNVNNVERYKIPIPSLEEQNSIVKFIEHQNEKSDLLQAKFEQEIELLKEYKTALISEVVTGKVDVREEVLAQ
ncbi:type I restriction enzyme S subunit [Winogradskyella pacifica]|uniref:Type I restriction enzyme S subunit n=1 Tax=Winogradskyella pacifica TaxID=664642 RepID=A0A3D9MZD0_9FLAO|nr:restriction endonuclease subunit S [Winogradskyella pacifica]REE25651.1 type I restriction enzyme S subunit [Winogradskyella pacifica]